jgi:hypothetical protein
MKQYVWLNWSNIDYKKHPYRNSYKSLQGSFEFPVDRFGITKGALEIPCVNMVKDPVYNLNNITKDFKDRYYDAFAIAADNVYSTVGCRTIHVLYSGGIDSICVLAALQRHKDYDRLVAEGRFKISMTTASIEECPSIFYNRILGNVPIQVLNYTTLMCDKDALLVTGDMGDHIIGSSDILGIVGYSDYDSSQPWNTLIPHIVKEPSSNLYMDMLMIAKKNAPFDIVSANQLIWWANQCYAFQDDLVKPWYWSRYQDYAELATQRKVFRFFYDDAFVSFTHEYMSTNPKCKNYHECKEWARSYAVNHFKIDSILSKEKVFSQRLTLRLAEKSQIYMDDGLIRGGNYNETV